VHGTKVYSVGIGPKGSILSRFPNNNNNNNNNNNSKSVVAYLVSFCHSFQELHGECLESSSTVGVGLVVGLDANWAHLSTSLSFWVRCFHTVSMFRYLVLSAYLLQILSSSDGQGRTCNGLSSFLFSGGNTSTKSPIFTP
jgi:hypothetical protein